MMKIDSDDIRKGAYLYGAAPRQPPHVRTPSLQEIARRIAAVKKQLDEIKAAAAAKKAEEIKARYQ